VETTAGSERSLSLWRQIRIRVTGIKAIYDQLSNSPHIDRLKEATGTTQFDVRIAFRDSETGIEYETLIVRTANGIEAVRRMCL
jgi:hypothetical protein